VYDYSARPASSDELPRGDNRMEPSVENDTPPWSRRGRRRSWLDGVRRSVTDALYEVIDAGFRIAAKLGRPDDSHRTTRTSEETRQR